LPSAPDPVLILDFGAQYAQLIARRVRECHVYSEIVPHSVDAETLARRNPKGIILSGGPASVYEPGAPDCDERIFRLGVPVLGICYGQQVMAQTLGGEVGHTEVGEYGKIDLEVVDDEAVLLSGLPSQTTAWMSHRDAVTKPPPGFSVTATTPTCPVAAMEDVSDRLFAVQFHPEVAHTPRGMDVMRNFLYRGCEALPTWTPVSIIDDAVESIRQQVGKSSVVCALSGGVDSAVAALIVHKAVGDQLTCVFVDHGLLRENEAEQVVATFKRHFHVELIHIDARERFLAALQGIIDPEAKRRIIGELFIRIFEEVAKGLGDVKFLVQGTLYPDVIESGGERSQTAAATIKTHHNVGGLPEVMGFELVEPLRNLFKDEVRKVGEELGLPAEIVWRQPFPGPGLAVRIVGEVTPERVEIVRRADAIVREELGRAGLEHEIWQSFAALLALRSVGVQGDERTYAYPIVVRAVTSEDAMTADWARIPDDVLERISNRITAEVRGVNRVVYDVTSKPPGTIEWE
jgi:GMP synthase (glutamine-hydrolysing)